jgi:hypothetical protein
MREAVAIVLLSWLIALEAFVLLSFVSRPVTPYLPGHNIGSEIAVPIAIAIVIEAAISSVLALRVYMLRTRVGAKL